MDFLKWDSRFLSLAKKVSSWSKDPSTKVGAVIADRKVIVSVGYNGLPEEIEDTPEILNNRELKYKKIIHAEENAFRFCKRHTINCTLYTYPFMPCDVCAKMVLSWQVARVVTYINTNERWRESFQKTRKFFAENNISLMEYSKNFFEE